LKRIGDNVKIVVNSLFKQIIDRFKNLCDFSSAVFDPTYIMAACLDPNNAKLLSDEEISKGISYIIPFVCSNIIHIYTIIVYSI
jgi:hypothetical protein